MRAVDLPVLPIYEYQFTNVTFTDSKLSTKQCVGCTYRNCDISEAWDFDLAESTFDECDFSSAKLHLSSWRDEQDYVDLRSGGNWYRPGQPPESEAAVTSWSKIFHEGQPRDALPF